MSPNASTSCLYGLDNFYYRRYLYASIVVAAVYTDLIISTIVDQKHTPLLILYRVYTDLIISTIVDKLRSIARSFGLYGLDNFYYRRYSDNEHGKLNSLYGLDNFYYRRCDLLPAIASNVYTDLIISTIVDDDDTPVSLLPSIRT